MFGNRLPRGVEMFGAIACKAIKAMIARRAGSAIA
jgi:hypothetical protein